MKNKGFILIFALWVLAMLTILAVSVAVGIRQKIILVQKLDERSRIRYLLEAALNQTKVYIHQQMAIAGTEYTPALKANVHNNPSVFGQISLNEDTAQVGYTLYDETLAAERFGVVDEERKLNLNVTNVVQLQRLLERVLSQKTDEAKGLAQAILDWRQWGESVAVGFFSQDYYSNLQYPYAKKGSDYETLDELLVVKGITKDIYEQILPYVTIYGEGKVNINTAPAPVLYALGLDDALIGKILNVRRGRDGIDGTLDDHVFVKTFDVAAEVNAVVKLDPQEIRVIDALNLDRLLTSNSYYFSVDIQARLSHGARERHAKAVIAVAENKIMYWRERS